MAAGFRWLESAEGALATDDRNELLGIARGAIEAELLGRPRREAGDRPALLTSRGAFVSLHDRDGALRGCVGQLRAERPLHETVARMAVAAATQDGRFEPVTKSDLDGLVIEISALGPLRAVRAEEVEVGRHGLLLRLGGRSGVLLPQVAVAHGWEREEFLAQTAAKAGLSEDAWQRPEVEIFVFEAEVFGETDPAPRSSA